MSFSKEKTLKEAEKLVAKGKYKEAVAEYQKIVKADPRDLGILNKVGDLQLQIGDRAAAIQIFAQIADRYAADGFNLRAIAMLKKCTRADPARWDFHERLADLNAQQGLINEAKASYTTVAEHYLKEGKSQQARELYAKIAAIEPENLKNRLKLADLYLRDNQINQALGEYQVIGAELAKKGMLEESLQVLEKALGLDPSNVNILRGMARTHADMGRAEEGLRFVRAKLQEKGGNDPDLLLVLGETFQAAGNFDMARQAFERAQQGAPERVDVRMALFKLGIDLGDADAALAQYTDLADRLVAAGKGAQVVEDLKSILKAKDGHVPTLEKLLAVQVELGADDKQQADGMGKLAEAYITAGRYEEAEAILRKLVVKEPDVSQHAEKLEFVRHKRSTGDVAPAPAPASPSLDTSFTGLSEAADAGFSMSFDEGELEATPQRGDDRVEFINERIAEADVFIKYGLVDKAVEQLEAVLAQYPDDLPTRGKLKNLLLEEGRRTEAVDQCLAMARIARQVGDAAAEREALAQAAQIDPAHPGVRAASAGAAPAAGGFDLGVPEPADAGGFDLSFDEPALAAPPAIDGFGASLSFDDVPTTPGPAAAAAPAPAADEFEISFDEPAPPAASQAGAAGEFEISLDASSGPDEAEFSISMDEPAAPEPAAARGAELDISVDGAPQDLGFGGAALEEPAPAEARDFSIDVPPVERVAVQAPPTAAAEAVLESPEPIAPPAAAEEGLFGEEDDFFNFAEELNKEMEGTAETEVSRDSDGMMTLEEIVSGIQKGVAAQVDKEDYETHYNLGIAYKEMGLTDEAIGEFQYASRDAGKFHQCCILLGACFSEKGMPELAIGWYEKARAVPGLGEEDVLALTYEIGLCHEATGEREAALKDFLSIYGQNARYRDVGQRVNSLKQAITR